MSASPWAPSSQTGGQQTAPVLPPPPMTQPGPPQAGPPLPPGAPQHQPRPPRRRGPWLLVVAAVLVLIAAVAATAAITYAVARDTTAPTADPSQPITPQAPQYTAAEQAAAKQSICNVFDVSARGQRGQGGMRINGDVNLQLVVRTVNSIIAVENALTPGRARGNHQRGPPVRRHLTRCHNSGDGQYAYRRRQPSDRCVE